MVKQTAYIWKLEKTVIKFSSYTNHLQFSFCCHHNKILPKDLQLKSRIKTKRSKAILQSAGQELLEEQIYINDFIPDRLKGKNLESMIPEEFNIIEKIHQNLCKTNN